MSIIDILTTRFGLVILSIICIALLICCLCKYLSNNYDIRHSSFTSHRDTISEQEALNRRIKFIEEYIELRKTLKDYLVKNNKPSNKDDIVVVVSPGEVQLGTKIQN